MAGVDVGTAYLTVVPSARGFAGKLQAEIGTGMADAGSKAGDVAAKGFGARFKSGLGLAAKAGAAAVAGALGLGIAFAKDAIGEARESQKVGALTESIIKSTGGAAKVTAGQVGDLATAISNKTGMDDEAIQSGANLLLTFKNVRNEVGQGANIFDRATQAATDLSAAGFGDVNGASKMLGKALNDPLKGLTALGRAGVTFTAQQQEQIKTLVESGKTLDAQKIILGEVESQVGGAAAASSTAGEKMSVAFGNFKEQIGTALLPLVDKFATWMTTKAIPAMSKFVTEFTNGTGPGGEFRDTVKDIGEKVKDAAKWISENGDKIKALVVTIGTAVAAFKTVTTTINVWKTAQLALNLVMSANPIGLVITAVAALAAGLIYAYNNSETFRNIVDGAFKAIAAAGRWMWNSVLAPVIRALVNGFAWVVEGIGRMLDALSNIPGFGWAKDAANKMREAAGKARDMAAGIRDIPDSATVDVKILVSSQETARAQKILDMASGGRITAKLADIRGYRAHGGPVASGSAYWVGDNPDGSLNATSELFVPKTAGTIFNQAQLAGMGGLSDWDIKRLAAAISGVQVQARISAGSLDAALAGRRA